MKFWTGKAGFPNLNPKSSSICLWMCLLNLHAPLNILLRWDELTLNILLRGGESEHLAGLAPSILIPCLKQCIAMWIVNLINIAFKNHSESLQRLHRSGSWDLLLHSRSGLRYGKDLKVRLHFACIGIQDWNWNPGHGTNNLFLKLKNLNIWKY